MDIKMTRKLEYVHSQKKTPHNKNISVQLVEYFRSEGKVKQCVVRHIGMVVIQANS